MVKNKLPRLLWLTVYIRNYVYVVYCYRPSSVVCRSVCHTSEPFKNGWTDQDAIWVEDLGGPREPCIRWGGPDTPIRRHNFGGKKSPFKYRDFLPWAVHEWPNRSTCHLNCELGWAEGSTSSIVFAKWRQCAHMGGHIGTTWWIWLNHPSVAVMWSYVKLLWPLALIKGHMACKKNFSQRFLPRKCSGRKPIQPKFSCTRAVKTEVKYTSEQH